MEREEEEKRAKSEYGALDDVCRDISKREDMTAGADTKRTRKHLLSERGEIELQEKAKRKGKDSHHP